MNNLTLQFKELENEQTETKVTERKGIIKIRARNAPAVQWLGLWTSTSGVWVPFLVGELLGWHKSNCSFGLRILNHYN